MTRGGWWRRFVESFDLHGYSRVQLFALAALSFAVAALGLNAGIRGSSMPAKASLQSAEGRVVELARTKSEVEFRLSDSARRYSYTSKSGASDRVRDRLRGAKHAVVWFDPGDTRKPAFSDREFYSVYAVSADGRVVRSYEDVAAARRNDDRLGWLLGAFGIASGLYFAHGGLLRAPRRRRAKGAH